MIIILLPGIWYSCISCIPVLLYFMYSSTLVLLISCTHAPALLLLLIAQSFRRPAEHAWCRDDEDVSHDHASVRRILNGTKYHTEQSATPYTWWGPPLESIGATSWIHSPQSKVSYGPKCHTIHVVGATYWICRGHLLNLWGYLLNLSSKKNNPSSISCRLVLAW